MTSYYDETQATYDANIILLYELFNIKAQLTNQDLLACCEAKIQLCRDTLAECQTRMSNISMAQNMGFSDVQMRKFI
jgi:hypothetical protein